MTRWSSTPCAAFSHCQWGQEKIGLGRIDLAHPKGWLRSLPAFIAGEDLLGFKVLHRTTGVGMRYTIYVHRLSTGELIGVVDALEITNLRTGAVSAVATDFLAPGDVGVAAIVGTGPVAGASFAPSSWCGLRPRSECSPGRRRTDEPSWMRCRDSSAGRLVESPTLEDALEDARDDHTRHQGDGHPCSWPSISTPGST